MESRFLISINTGSQSNWATSNTHTHTHTDTRVRGRGLKSVVGISLIIRFGEDYDKHDPRISIKDNTNQKLGLNDDTHKTTGRKALSNHQKHTRNSTNEKYIGSTNVDTRHELAADNRCQWMWFEKIHSLVASFSTFIGSCVVCECLSDCVRIAIKLWSIAQWFLGKATRYI